VGPVTRELGIRDVSEQTGLTIDTLRWYEKEGLIPLVQRSPDGRRRYPPAAVRFIRLVQALRRTGMPVADVREFVQLGGGTLDVHPVRLGLLERQTAAIEQRLAELAEDLAVVRAKAADYRRLIALGLDCEDAVADQVALA
jgi:DNA-binding transcriptional MerR regulator